ncbi:LpqB family beta-propeller domain-containing protein [Citricoccus sp.]|mgnify:CR=1 FL=1|uniref:LpqB family beta-propeller domain-containing protein n=1 Tax=Citricoccus sp. TaxID=1978372 RepID=UPI0026196050|nr:LpqB family beta-propeller domain-containing protein [Citricoccus sp.]HRO30280.1 LpqB family beta-propeller domain-containing protein [Citricoccus sp.]HRO93102.1 LpqB family beta-propeller domain-containing protein [Citricoccus sp.]
MNVTRMTRRVAPRNPGHPVRWRWLVLVVAGLLVLSGCARLPQGGPVGTSEPLAGNDNQVNYTFTPAGPSDGDSPEEIIRGFLTAGTGVQDDYATAREFLTEDAAAAWQPNARTLVYTSEPTLVPSATDNVFTVQMEVESVVDDRGIMSRMPANTTEAAEFEVTEEDGQWRITRAPAGVVLETTQFRALFGSHELYFYDQSYQYAVPDVRWFLNRPGTAADIVDALLDGPAPYLEGAVRTAFQSGSELARPSVPISGGAAKVDFTQQTFEGTDALTRHRMQQQLELTLGGLNNVSTVELSVDLDPIDLGPTPDGFVTARVNPSVGSTQVAVADGQLVYYEGDAAVPVGGLRTDAGEPPALPAMSLDGTRFAFLNPDRDQMRTADTDGSQRLVLQGSDLTRPSFDLSGWVWTVDHAQGTRVMAIDAGTGGAGDEATREISAEWIGDREVSALRISRDGTRAAIVAGEGGSNHLYLAGVIRDSEGVPRGLGAPVRLEPTVPITEVTWLSDQELVVASTSPNEPVEAQVVGFDGSLRTLKPLLGMTGLSTGPADNPIYAETAEAVHALAGSTWRSQAGVAEDLAFPG